MTKKIKRCAWAGETSLAYIEYHGLSESISENKGAALDHMLNALLDAERYADINRADCAINAWEKTPLSMKM